MPVPDPSPSKEEGASALHERAPCPERQSRASAVTALSELHSAAARWRCGPQKVPPLLADTFSPSRHRSPRRAASGLEKCQLPTMWRSKWLQRRLPAGHVAGASEGSQGVGVHSLRMRALFTDGPRVLTGSRLLSGRCGPVRGRDSDVGEVGGSIFDVGFSGCGAELPEARAK